MSKEMENLKSNQMKILELKNAKSEIEKTGTTESFPCRLAITEGIIMILKISQQKSHKPQFESIHQVPRIINKREWRI